ncbi:hypothetical protein [Paludibacterium denitrificans]|uniref:hypothetical protein n=1 Tax=Paludibacterium denitrificans TaxID=2675226 RepID=UPI001E5A1E73|nr:hypothetical protein [Paludibacterium denitrificans]
MSLPSSLSPEEQDLQATYARLRASWQQERVPTLSQRRDWLNQLERLLLDNKSAIVEAVSRDFGHRSEVETQLAELFPALQGIRHARHHLKAGCGPSGAGYRCGFNRRVPV